MAKRMKKKKSVLLRIDQGLWNDLNEWASHELRSLNGQIEYTLREAVRRRKKRKLSGKEEDDKI